MADKPRDDDAWDDDAWGDDAWGDEAAAAKRAEISDIVRGEVRLARVDDASLLQFVQEGPLEDAVPERAKPELLAFARDRLTAERALLRNEARDWPETTDCDRLDAAVDALQADGIVLWPVSPCCDTCTMGEFPDYVAELIKEDRSLEETFRGYAFFIDQTMAERLSEGTEISVHLGYGSTRGEEGDAYPPAAVAIGHDVVAALEAAGLDVTWDGTLEKKIGLSLDWKRRG